MNNKADLCAQHRKRFLTWSEP